MVPLLLLAGCAGFAGAAAAQDGHGGAAARTARPAPSHDASEDDIVVNGQAPPGSVIGDIPPENRLTPADIAGYGVGTVSELLDQLSPETQSNEGRDSSSGPVVLVNGKRISGIDEVSDLPTESILRVDILPEEVALKYGYDAQRKVVNIILRRHFQSRVANLGGGMATEGQGGNIAGDLTYTRIRDNNRLNIAARVKTAASLLESDRGILPQPAAAIDPTGQIADDTGYRTLAPSTRSYALNATLARQLSDKVNASFNLKGSYATSRALDGLASATLAVPADGPFGSGMASGIDRFLTGDPLRQSIDTGSVDAGVTVDADLSTRWKLSFVAGYAHGETRTATDRGYAISALQAAIDGGDPAVDPYGVLPTGLLGSRLHDRASAISDSGNASLLATGKLFKLPAGEANGSLQIGGDVSALRASADRSAPGASRTANRATGNAKFSLDLPITSRKKAVLGAIGDLSATLNGGVTQISGYGTLGTLGYGLNWTPLTGVTIIAAINEDRVAPTLAQRGDPLVDTRNVRIYDYARGQTVTVASIAGGNPDLRADDRHVVKLGITVKPVTKPKYDVTLTANYANSRTRNAIGTLSGVTPALEAAFPDRFVRDEDGNLVEIDTRPVNFAREDRQQLRWGVNLTAVLRAPKRPPPPPGGWGRFGRRWGEGAQRAPGERPEPAPEGAAGVGTPPDMPPPDTPPPDTPPPGGGAGSDIVVNGRTAPGGQGDAPPPPPDGDGPPPGPPPDGAGPPPDGFGPPHGGGAGGFGPPGGRGHGFRGGSDNGMRLQFSLYHSWVFSDRVVLRDGEPGIDLLGGGTLGGAPRPRHTVQLNTGVIDNGVGIRLTGSWKSGATVAGDGGSAAGDLRFSSLTTFDLRLFANLANRFRGKAWARGTRVSFTVANLFDQRQHVRDATGATPLAYQPAYLDPYGRTLFLTVRRIF